MILASGLTTGVGLWLVVTALLIACWRVGRKEGQ